MSKFPARAKAIALPEENLFKKIKNILGSKQEKKNFAKMQPLSLYSSFYQQPGKPVWMTRDFTRFAEEGYIKNVIAYRCINLISQSAAGAPWLLYHAEGVEKKEVKVHPLLDLLKSPNPATSGSDFFESLYAYRMISGNSFIQAVYSGDGEMPAELHILRPDRVTVICGNNYFPKAYRYKVGDNYKDFKVDQVSGQSDILHLKNFHPLNDWYGLSAMESAAYSIDLHNDAAEWNKSLLQNGARPTGALVVKMGEGVAGNLSDEQYDRIKSQIETQFSGAVNSGRPLLLEGGLEWQEMSISPKDMDFLNSKHSSARDIALAFGVPPQLLGIPGDNTYNNMAEARLALWENTVIPLLQNITDSLNSWLLPMFGNNLKLEYDLDEVSALTPRRDKVWARIEKANFMTINEKRHLLGYDPIEGGDTL